MSFEPRVLGKTGVSVGPIGLGSSYGIAGRDVEEAFERGFNYLYWGSWRRSGFGDGLRAIAKKNRDKLVLVVQSYTRVGMLMKPSVEWALHRLGLDHADVLLLGMWNKEPPARIVDAALEAKARGVVRHLAISTHHRPLAPTLGKTFDIIHVRYNAAHRGAEREIFPHLPAREAKRERPGVVSFTATRWGGLMKAKGLPPADRRPTAADCYRFVLSNPDVDLTLAGPRNGADLKGLFDAIDKGPMSADELDWMRHVGDHVHAKAMYGE
ncbi:MAG: aldo/keto reductase [Deltaproteobacteria bacterium]|nr:aldo/keto reductase [Deltaproteobacteria bacterium]